MDAKEFYRLFQNGLAKTITRARACWKNATDYTDYIIDMIDKEVLQEKFSTEERKNTGKEYFRIDLVAYTDRKNELSAPPSKTTKKSFNFNKHLWDLRVAVEHENADTSWMDEVIKLAHIACPLRVVIGYLPKEEDKCAYLEYVHNALCNLDAYDNVQRGELLIILGDTRCESENEFCTYFPYIYKKNGFLPLE